MALPRPFLPEQEATSNKYLTGSNRCLTSSNKKLVETRPLTLGGRSLISGRSTKGAVALEGRRKLRFDLFRLVYIDLWTHLDP